MWRVEFETDDNYNFKGVALYDGLDFPPTPQTENSHLYCMKITKLEPQDVDYFNEYTPKVGALYGIFACECLCWEKTVEASRDQQTLLEVAP